MIASAGSAIQNLVADMDTMYVMIHLCLQNFAYGNPPIRSSSSVFSHVVGFVAFSGSSEGLRRHKQGTGARRIMKVRVV